MLTTYLANALVNHTLRNTTYTSPSTVYVGLYTQNPTVAGTQTHELADSAYTRIDAAGGGAGSTGWAAASGGATSNAQLVQFPAIADAQVTVTYVAVFDAATNGNMLMFDVLRDSNGDPAPRTLEIGDVLRFEIGSIDFAAQ